MVIVVADAGGRIPRGRRVGALLAALGRGGGALAGGARGARRAARLEHRLPEVRGPCRLRGDRGSRGVSWTRVAFAVFMNGRSVQFNGLKATG